jgi:hypothetical protein
MDALFRDDQASIDRFFDAVTCLDTVRITRSNGSDEGEPEPTPSDPTPTPSDPVPVPQG